MLPKKTFRKLKKLIEAVLVAFMLVLILVSGGWAKKLSPEIGLYNEARKGYYALMGSKSKRGFSHNWINIIKKFKKIWERYPHSNEAPKALFTVAKLYHRLYLEHKGAKNLENALFYYQKVVSNFADSPLSDDALFRKGDIFLKRKNYKRARDTFEKVINKFPRGDQVTLAQKKLATLLPLMTGKKVSLKVKKSNSRPFVKKGNLKTRRPIIVIDPGHGGKDTGAHSKNGLLEKHVNLAISKRLKRTLETKYNYRVIMTRTIDHFVPLEKRGDIANKNHANLFVSIHTNAARREGANGIETYHLGVGSSERARETAARENGEIVYAAPDSDVQKILVDMITLQKINGSSCLAVFVQENLIKGMKKKYSVIKDLGVKEGPFYVLHRTNMPSILVEVGFITNHKEQRRLANFGYLERLAQYIARGIHIAMPIKRCTPTI